MNTPSRRKFLVGSVAGTLLLLKESRAQTVVAIQRTSWPSAASEGSVTAATVELLRLLNAGTAILVKTGVHSINKAINVTVARVDILGEDGAVIQVESTTEGALRFYNTSSGKIGNLQFRWPGTGRPVRNNNGPAIYFGQSSNIVIDNVQTFRSPGAGILFNNCTNPRVTNTTINYSGADGIHYANCGNAFGSNLVLNYTGDDAVAVVDYADRAAPGGFTIVGVKVTESLARGLAIVGGSRGIATDIMIDGCGSNNIHIEQDAYYKTRNPYDVTVRRAVVTRAGGTLPKAGNQYGVNVLRAKKILLEDINITSSTNIGVSLVSSDDVTLTNVTTTNSVGTGLRVQSVNGLKLSKIKITDVGSNYIAVTDSSQVGGDVELTYFRDLPVNTPPVQIARTTGVSFKSLNFVGFPANTLRVASTSNSGSLAVTNTVGTLKMLATTNLTTSSTSTKPWNGIRQVTDSLSITSGN